MSNSKADAVFRETEQRLCKLVSGDEAIARGKLANLRRGAGKKPGEDPHIWGMLFCDLPEDMLGQNMEPSKEEWAIHTALTLFSIHQQGNDLKGNNVNRKGISFGRAASGLVLEEGGDEDARERVARRFHQVALAPDMSTMAYYLRSFVQLLRSKDIGLDYPMLARDLYLYQLIGGEAGVRLQWGQDFYRKYNQNETEENEK